MRVKTRKDLIPRWAQELAIPLSRFEKRISVLEKRVFQVIDPEALKDEFRPISVVLAGSSEVEDRETVSEYVVSVYWELSRDTVFVFETSDYSEAKRVFNEISEKLEEVQKLVMEDKSDEASEKMKDLLKEFMMKTEKIVEKEPPRSLTQASLKREGGVVDLTRSFIRSLFKEYLETRESPIVTTSKPLVVWSTLGKSHKGTFDYVVSYFDVLRLDGKIVRHAAVIDRGDISFVGKVNSLKDFEELCSKLLSSMR